MWLKISRNRRWGDRGSQRQGNCVTGNRDRRYPDSDVSKVGTTRVKVVDRCHTILNDRRSGFGKRQVPELKGFGFANSRTPIHRGRTGVHHPRRVGKYVEKIRHNHNRPSVGQVAATENHRCLAPSGNRCFRGQETRAC